MTSLFGLLLFLLAAPDQPPSSGGSSTDAASAVTLESVDGPAWHGRLLSIDDEGLVHCRVDERDEHVPLDDLTRIEFASHKAPAQKPAMKAGATLYFADGGVVDAGLVASLDGDRGIRADIGLAAPVDVPFSALGAIRFATRPLDAVQAELSRRLGNQEAGRDLLIAEREGRPVVLPGTLERITPEAWTFRIGDKSQTAPLDKAYAVVLSRPLTASAAPPAEISLRSGGTLLGRIRSADARAFQIDAGALGTMNIPFDFVASITLRSGRIVHLADLEPATVTQRSYFDLSWPPRKNCNVSGGPIRLEGRRYERGLGVHAYTSMTWQLAGEYEQYTATIGIDESVAPRGRAVFRVLCDGKAAYDSGPIEQGQATRIKVDLTGVKTLTLECDPGDDLDISDHCNWAAARLVRAKSAS